MHGHRATHCNSCKLLAFILFKSRLLQHFPLPLQRALSCPLVSGLQSTALDGMQLRSAVAYHWGCWKRGFWVRLNMGGTEDGCDRTCKESGVPDYTVAAVPMLITPQCPMPCQSVPVVRCCGCLVVQCAVQPDIANLIISTMAS